MVVQKNGRLNNLDTAIDHFIDPSAAAPVVFFFEIICSCVLNKMASQRDKITKSCNSQPTGFQP